MNFRMAPRSMTLDDLEELVCSWNIAWFHRFWRQQRLKKWRQTRLYPTKSCFQRCIIFLRQRPSYTDCRRVACLPLFNSVLCSGYPCSGGRIHKLCSVMHSVYNRRSAAYIPVSQSRLRLSSSSTDYRLSRLRTCSTNHLPRRILVCNALPEHIHTRTDCVIFKTRLLVELLMP